MDHSLHIRRPLAADIPAISLVIQRTIHTACAADHRNDPKVVAAWVRSARVEQIRRQLAEPGLCARLALLQGKAVGVGMARADGEIALCFVQPEFSRRGVGLALMEALHDYLAGLGCISAHLSSTLTGRGFYRSLGYGETGQRYRVGGLDVILMEKSLLAPDARDWTTRLSASL